MTSGGRHSRTPFSVSTSGRSISLGSAAIASSTVSSSASGKAALLRVGALRAHPLARGHAGIAIELGQLVAARRVLEVLHHRQARYRRGRSAFRAPCATCCSSGCARSSLSCALLHACLALRAPSAGPDARQDRDRLLRQTRRAAPAQSPDRAGAGRKAGTAAAASAGSIPGAGAALILSCRRATRPARWIARTSRG